MYFNINLNFSKFKKVHLLVSEQYVYLKTCFHNVAVLTYYFNVACFVTYYIIQDN